MSKALEILKQYWKHDAFRLPQEEIINSVLDKQDTFGVMPTGGGKSVCFQIPTLLMDGIGLVISPLVALMKDQVANLQEKGIKAIALTGGIGSDEIIDLLDNCQYGNYKFLYLSPERLQSDWIIDRIKSLPINLITIDEAHCVSQWGHDFRPAYLKISKLREHFTTVPFLALTASATLRVQEDIRLQLKLKNPKVFVKSFARPNIAYMVVTTEDKLQLIQQILTKNPESSIIYVTNRKACVTLVKQLASFGFTATYYHGGLTLKEKEKQMELWMKDKVQTMVATNAFGMGIDKPDVRTVIHIHLPQNMENYYQEAGRAGRNGTKSFAVLLTNPSDAAKATSQFLSLLSDKIFLNLIFVKICNYFQIAYGEGIDESFSFNINQFCVKYNLPLLKTYNALQFLDRQGIITLSQEYSEKITVQFTIPSKEVIRYVSLNPKHEPIVLTLLRAYPGIYDIATTINTSIIAKKTNSSENEIVALLHHLNEKGIISLQARNNDATITFNEIREDERTISKVVKYLEAQNRLKTEQLQSVIAYVKNENTCKSNLILSYFGEENTENCGICSYCIQHKKTDWGTATEKIIQLLKIQDLNSKELKKLSQLSKEAVITTIQNLMEQEIIELKTNQLYSIKNK